MDSVNYWNPEKVWQWLSSQDYSNLLSRQKWKYTDGSGLLKLTKDHLELIGVPPYLCPRLLEDIAKLRKSNIIDSRTLPYTNTLPYSSSIRYATYPNKSIGSDTNLKHEIRMLEMEYNQLEAKINIYKSQGDYLGALELEKELKFKKFEIEEKNKLYGKQKSGLGSEQYVYELTQSQCDASSGPHALKNAFRAVGLTPLGYINMMETTADFEWMKKALRNNHNPHNIKVFNNERMITDRGNWEFGFDEVLQMITHGQSDIALIVNIPQIHHWLTFSIHHKRGQILPVRIYDSSQNEYHSSAMIATTIYTAARDVVLRSIPMKDMYIYGADTIKKDWNKNRFGYLPKKGDNILLKRSHGGWEPGYVVNVDYVKEEILTQGSDSQKLIPFRQHSEFIRKRKDDACATLRGDELRIRNNAGVFVKRNQFAISTLGKKTKVKILCIGINYSEDSSKEKLNAINDVKLMHRRIKILAENCGYIVETKLLTDERNPIETNIIKATRRNVCEHLMWLCQDLNAGDIAYLHFIGHGGQDFFAKDKNNRSNEILFCCDGESVTKGYLENIFDSFKENVYVYAIFDCCHRGAFFNLSHVYDPERKDFKTDHNQKDTKANIYILSSRMNRGNAWYCRLMNSGKVKYIGALSQELSYIIDKGYSWSDLFACIYQGLHNRKWKSVPQLESGRSEYSSYVAFWQFMPKDKRFNPTTCASQYLEIPAGPRIKSIDLGKSSEDFYDMIQQSYLIFLILYPIVNLFSFIRCLCYCGTVENANEVIKLVCFLISTLLVFIWLFR